MKSMTKSIKFSFGEITYTLTRKNVKNINLRVKADGNIYISANNRVSVSYIESFLKEKEDFIFNALKRIAATTKETDNWGTEYGKKLPVFGREYTVFLISSIRNKAYIDNNSIIIESNDIEDKKKSSDIVVDFYRTLTEEKIEEKFLNIYNNVFPKSENPPKTRVRKMTSMWGNCCPSKSTITFSAFLTVLPEECIDYVVYHEIVHLIHADHSKKFYDALEIFLPDFKERKNKMCQYGTLIKKI